jgi:hypothetical protein
MNAFNLPVSDDVIFPIALRAARGDTVLADEAVQHVRVQFWRGLCDPARPFLPWATTVLRRYCLDAVRPRIRAAGGEAPLPDAADPHADIASAEHRLDLCTPFCAEDRATVLAWNPRPRLVLLAWHGLWDKLAPPDREATLVAVRPRVPFPVPDFFAWPNKQRTRYLARVVRRANNTIAQICLRDRHRLARLRCIRDLRGE